MDALDKYLMCEILNFCSLSERLELQKCGAFFKQCVRDRLTCWSQIIITEFINIQELLECIGFFKRRIKELIFIDLTEYTKIAKVFQGVYNCPLLERVLDSGEIVVWYEKDMCDTLHFSNEDWRDFAHKFIDKVLESPETNYQPYTELVHQILDQESNPEYIIGIISEAIIERETEFKDNDVNLEVIASLCGDFVIFSEVLAHFINGLVETGDLKRVGKLLNPEVFDLLCHENEELLYSLIEIFVYEDMDIRNILEYQDVEYVDVYSQGAYMDSELWYSSDDDYTDLPYYLIYNTYKSE